MNNPMNNPVNNPVNNTPNPDPNLIPAMPPTVPPTVAVSEYTIAALGQILGMCEEFLRTAGPTVHAELRGYLACQYPPADPAWLIDMLGFHTLHLHHQIPTTAPSPRDNHQPPNEHAPAHVGEVTL